ncbi:hypothetical protein [Streptomyces reniochalinae]|uniref:Uncharacterized protein n=1 Tax=Streptomyces reniochalinae TaxID=2250578 RepID=A0A367EB97_9ACTN|nr:hypothetical protein [Streptomyces reniochalinae]RCG14925.1 hypothetical protein DQ392_28075 [Streptomyces reniochalinae]
MTDEQPEHDELPEEPEASAEPAPASGSRRRRPGRGAAGLTDSFASTGFRVAGGSSVGMAVRQAAAVSSFGSAHVRLRESLTPALDLTSGALLGPRFTFAAEEFVRHSGIQEVFSSPLHGLDLRHLMPGAPMGRSGAFDFARKLNSRWSALTERMELLLPDNWRGEDLDFDAVLRVLEDGIPLVWVPSSEVIRGLAAEADAAARRTVLEERAATVIEDCRSAIKAITREDLTAHAAHVNDCLSLITEGRCAAAQALSASVWDTTLRAVARADPALRNGKRITYGSVKKGMPKATLGTAIGQFRSYCIHTSVHAACVNFDGPPTPVPEHYSRHATSHAVGPTQYTKANALAAVMLAVGLLRELEETQRPIILAE